MGQIANDMAVRLIVKLKNKFKLRKSEKSSKKAKK